MCRSRGAAPRRSPRPPGHRAILLVAARLLLGPGRRATQDSAEQGTLRSETQKAAGRTYLQKRGFCLGVITKATPGPGAKQSSAPLSKHLSQVRARGPGGGDPPAAAGSARGVMGGSPQAPQGSWLRTQADRRGRGGGGGGPHGPLWSGGLRRCCFIARRDGSGAQEPPPH